MKRLYAALAVLVMGAAIVASMVANAVYTRHVQRESDARHTQAQVERDRAAQQARQQGLRLFCTWIYDTWLDPELGPATTERGERVLAANRTFYQQIGCKGAP